MILQAIFDELQKLKCPGLKGISNNNPSSDSIVYFRGGSFWIVHTGLSLYVSSEWVPRNDGSGLMTNHDREFLIADPHLITKLLAIIIKIAMAVAGEGESSETT